ncbi:MAG: alpha-galactosidase [Spirochaetales bacterium]|nr:MAG: alpha-galactosidase [Spirochaetales bacterium]
MFIIFAVLTLLAPNVSAQDYRGISISTDFPSISSSSREMITFKLKVENYNLPPQRIDLTMSRKPQGWNHEFMGNGSVINAVFASSQEGINLELWLEPPASVPAGTYSFLLRAQGQGYAGELPITIKIDDILPQRLKFQPELPSLKGSSNAEFSYRVNLENKGSQDSFISFRAEAPQGFQITFKEAFGNKEFAGMPLEAGKPVRMEVRVKPPQNTKAGRYVITIFAIGDGAQEKSELVLEITGQPELVLTGSDERLSGSANAGKKKIFILNLENKGSANAFNVRLASSEPSGWIVDFEPASFQEIPPNAKLTVKANITPSPRALAGDYVVNLRALGDAVSVSEDFRITVKTSTLWGILGVLIIAIALIVVALAVLRYGRR